MNVRGRKKESNSKMTKAELRRIGKLIWGAKNGWQTSMAEFLGLDPSSVRRLVAGKSRIAGPVRAALRERLSRAFR